MGVRGARPVLVNSPDERVVVFCETAQARV
jgi:hypothetical protein